MRQLTFVRHGKLEWRDVAPPRLQGPLAALVRPIVVATCDLDAAMLAAPSPLFRGPFPIGHEFVAEVAEVGEAVRRVRPGDRVVVPFQISCGACDRCRRGLTGSCETVPHRSMYGLGRLGGNHGGALADLVRVPFADHMLVPVPEGVAPLAIASASDNLPDAWRTVGPALRECPGGSVLVVGGSAASIGLYAAGMAVALGAGKVDYLDTDAGRLGLAERLGANPLDGAPPRRLGPYAVTVDASGDPAGLACALRSLEPEGVCTSAAIYFGRDVPLPLWEMYDGCVTFRTGRAHVRRDIPDVLALVGDGTFRPELVTGAVVGWEDAPEALQEPGVKTVVVRDGGP